MSCVYSNKKSKRSLLCYVRRETVNRGAAISGSYIECKEGDVVISTKRWVETREEKESGDVELAGLRQTATFKKYGHKWSLDHMVTIKVSSITL